MNASRARRRRAERAEERRRRGLCGSPTGCDQVGAHVVVDPVYGGNFRACEDHWPDLVAVIWAEGGWVSGCPCPECIGQEQGKEHA